MVLGGEFIFISLALFFRFKWGRIGFLRKKGVISMGCSIEISRPEVLILKEG